MNKLVEKHGVQVEINYGDMPEELVEDVPGNRTAMLVNRIIEYLQLSLLRTHFLDIPDILVWTFHSYSGLF